MKVVLGSDAEKEFAELPRTIQRRVLAVAERLRNWPKVSGSKTLTGQWKGHQRIRTGDYRVIFAARSNEIEIVKIAHRKEVYE